MGDPHFAQLRQFQRCNSLNAMRPLPTPPAMRGSMRTKGSSNHFMSSRSSIFTDASEQFDEHALEANVLQDSDDLLIPDEMQRFLSEKKMDPIAMQPPPPPGNSES
jgi:hypothetical protein